MGAADVISGKARSFKHTITARLSTAPYTPISLPAHTADGARKTTKTRTESNAGRRKILLRTWAASQLPGSFSVATEFKVLHVTTRMGVGLLLV